MAGRAGRRAVTGVEPSSRRRRFRGPWAPRSPVVWSLIVLGIAIGIVILAGVSDPAEIALIIGGYLVLGVIGWYSNYEELREDGVFISSAAGIHGVHVSSGVIPYESIFSVSRSHHPRDVDLQCSENGVAKKLTVWVPIDQRDEFIADLGARIEAKTGRRIEVSEDE